MKYTEIAKQLGSRGGKKSVEVRLGGLTKEQKSEIMRKVRLSFKELENFKQGAEKMVNNMQKNI